jgi:hypothetical protein
MHRDERIKTFFEGIESVLLYAHVQEVGKLNDDDKSNIAGEAIDITAKHFDTLTAIIEDVIYPRI